MSGPANGTVRHEEVAMKLRLISVAFIATLVVLCACCKKKNEPQATVLQGYGVLTVLVQDEGGKALEGAEVTIANSSDQRHSTKTRADGRIKGAGKVLESPFSIAVTMAGYETQEKDGVTLSESQPVFLVFKLQRSKL